MKMQESGEMYLETILVLSKKIGHVRAIDIVNHLGYSKPSVSRAVSLLRQGGFVEAGAAGGILLTDEGNKIAGRIFERHQVLTEFLARLGVQPQTASDDACRIEHVISQESFERIKAWIDRKSP